MSRGGRRDGSGRKNLDVESKSVALKPKQWIWLNKRAKKLGVSRNKLLRDIVLAYKSITAE